MEALVREGLVRNIGICNVGTNMIREVLSYAKIKPAVLQVEMHPYLTQEKLLRMAREHGIQVMAFSNFGPSSYVELGMATVEESILSLPVVK
jgi:D-xylose reductase